MGRRAIPGAHWIMLALVGALAVMPGAAHAQESAATPDETTPPAENAPLPDESTVLGNALMFDPSSLVASKPAKKLHLPGLTDQQRLDVKRTDKPDGSSTVAVKQPLSAEWDAKIGADLGFASADPDGYQSGRPLSGGRDERSSGAAWASVGVTDRTTVDARFDRSNDQGKIGTSLKQGIPFGKYLSVTLQNSYSVTEPFSAPSAGPSDLPLMTPAVPTTQPMPQVWANEKAAKFNILPTGTTLGASVASSSVDPVTHNTLSAEQKLYGPLQVTTAVTDVGQPSASKKVTAGFKLHW
jgi:hypothetical protein